jgi:hypothetical protein
MHNGLLGVARDVASDHALLDESLSHLVVHRLSRSGAEAAVLRQKIRQLPDQIVPRDARVRRRIIDQAPQEGKVTDETTSHFVQICHTGNTVEHLVALLRFPRAREAALEKFQEVGSANSAARASPHDLADAVEAQGDAQLRHPRLSQPLSQLLLVLHQIALHILRLQQLPLLEL